MNLFHDLPPPPSFATPIVRPGDPWPDTGAEKHAVLTILAGEATPSAFDQEALSSDLDRCVGAFLAVGEPGWRWTMRGVQAVAAEVQLPALVIIVECSAAVDLQWLDLISKRSRLLGMTEAAPLPSIPNCLN